MKLISAALQLLFLLLPSAIAAQPSPATNLTSYLLSTYSTSYTATIAHPTFFTAVKNGTVSPARVAYFFSQDVLYGRGFLGLTAHALGQIAAFRPNGTSECNDALLEGGEVEELVLEVVSNWGGTASGLADEAGMLERERRGIVGAVEANGTVVQESEGTRAYVEFMLGVGGLGRRDGFGGLVCAWVMGKAFIDVWTEIQRDQQYKPNKIPELQSMIDYWADPSYVAAVDATGDLVDAWYATFQGDLGRAEQIFLQTLEKEAGFWQSVDSWTG